MKFNVLILVFNVVLVSLLGFSQGGSLIKNFYKHTACPGAEDIVKKEAEKQVAKDPTVSAKLLRMHFHDCFVRVSHFSNYHTHVYIE